MWVFVGEHDVRSLDHLVIFVDQHTLMVAIDCAEPISLEGDEERRHFHCAMAYEALGQPDKIAEIYEGDELIGVLTRSVEHVEGVDQNTAVLIRLWLGEAERIREFPWPARDPEHLLREELACLGEIVLAFKDGVFSFIDEPLRLGCFKERGE